MKPPIGPRSFLALAVIAAALAVSVGRPAAAGSSARTPIAALSLDEEQRKADKVVNTLRLPEILGPLAPVALSPFFALTFLSGASLLADSGVLPDAIAKNALIGASSPLNNSLVFCGLLALTVVTALPKLTKVTKPLAQAIDQIEAHAGIVSVVLVQLLSQVNLGDAPPEQAAVVIQAGIFSFSWSVLLAVFSALNIFVINTVKFLFEVLIWLSPISAVDAVFEAANKAFAALLLAVYLVSPWLATLINLVIFAICLAIFAWAHRRVVYLRSICGDPLFGWIAEKVFRRPPATPTSTRLPPSLAALLPAPTLVLVAFAGKPYQGLRRKSRGFLVQSGGRLHFARTRFLRSPLVVALPLEGHTVRLEKGLLANTVRLEDDAGEPAVKILVTRRYNRLLEAIRVLLGAVEPEAKPARDEKLAEIGRAAGAAIKGGARAELRAELG